MSRDHSLDAGFAGALRWAGAGIVVVGLHLGIGALLVGRSMLPSPPDAAQVGVPIDLEPVTVPQDETASVPAPPPGRPDAEQPPAPQPTPDPPAAEPAPAEPPTPALSSPPPPVVEKPPAPPPPSAAAPSTATAPPPEPAPPALPSLPDLPPARNDDDATLARPMPVPRPVVKTVAKVARPAPKPVDRQAEAVARREAEDREAKRNERRDAARQAARQRTAEQRAAVLSAPARGAEPQQRASASAATSASEIAAWRGQVSAHLNQFKRSPADGGSGTALVSFSVNAHGGVSGVRLAGSSGDPALDAAALAMIARADPVPPPPPGLGSRISLSIPVRFSGE